MWEAWDLTWSMGGQHSASGGQVGCAVDLSSLPCMQNMQHDSASVEMEAAVAYDLQGIMHKSWCSMLQPKLASHAVQTWGHPPGGARQPPMPLPHAPSLPPTQAAVLALAATAFKKTNSHRVHWRPPL